jgi:CO/xanthine dehydrogenase FAD-binding subunit
LLLGAALVQAEELRRVVAEIGRELKGRGTIDVAVRGMGDAMVQHENLQELLTRLNNIRDSMEEALGDIKGIEDDYRRGLLEAHIRGAIREINAQISELVSSHQES